MTKKHKAKGGNQQKPHKKKSFRDKVAQGSSSGHSTRVFSMRDEALGTSRHDHQWSSQIRLRARAVPFVSAGAINPLEELDSTEPRGTWTRSEGRSAEDLDSDQKALAQMHIQSPDNACSSDGEFGVGMEVETTEVSTFPSSAQDTPSKGSSDGSAQEQPFFTDVQGDGALAPKGPSPVIRDMSMPPDLGSDEEVVVFRGRSKRVVDWGAPAGTEALRHSQTTVEPSAANSVARDAALPSESQKESDALSSVPSMLIKRVVHTSSELGQKTKKARGSKKGGKRSKRSHRGYTMLSDGPDLPDDVIDDFISNVYGPEQREWEKEFEQRQREAAKSDSEWVSSVMGDDDDIEDEARVTSASAPVARQSGRRKVQDPTVSSGPNTDMDMTDESWFPSNIDDRVDGMEEDDDDESGTSDPGDNASLVSDLSYTAAQRWEDESDLRQRQIDAMTDEEMARILAKQEELGLGSDELLLIDDVGLTEAAELAETEAQLNSLLSRRAAARPQHVGRRNKKARDSFPDASLMADVLDADPYGGFDIMDLERPSLRPAGKKGRKSAGGLPAELAALSDEDLVNDLAGSWQRDRAKKAARKAEREELRAEGMLGRDKKSKFGPDIQVKFADGLSLGQLRRELGDFLDDDEVQQKAFPPMEKKERKLLHEIANVFNLVSQSRGSGRNRFTVMHKRRQTVGWEDSRWNRVERIAQRGFIKGSGGSKSRSSGGGAGGWGGSGLPARAGRGGGFSSAAVTYANGEVVGAAAPELAEGNFGRKLMEKMGWEKGKSLGKEGGKGMLLPVEARVKSGRGGLG